MYAWIESHPIAHSDSDILSLSWKGSVPNSEKEKQYIRKRNCVTGWLAVGTRKCVVGVTFSTIHTLKEYNHPLRTNFNLRGHNAEVVLVRWNEPFQKMATCDANGVIFVWIRFESRWSIELVNDRQHQVTDFAWSHDGRMALIAYKDGFVLVGSVQGQRYWSSQLNLQPHGSSITCGAWTADDKTVLFGTNSGQIVAMDIHGAVLSQVGLSDRTKPIQYMCYNCEKFRMSFIAETIDGENRVSPGAVSVTSTTTATPAATTAAATNTVSTSANSAPSTSSATSAAATAAPSSASKCSKRSRNRNRNLMMAVQIGSREINFMRSYEDVVGILTDTMMTDLKLEWSSCGSLLAVGGWCCNEKSPKVKFYALNGMVRFTLNVPSKRSISALTWAHNDKRLFIASGAGVFVALIDKHLSSLQQLARNAIVESLHGPITLSAIPTSEEEDSVLESVGLPTHLKKFVSHAMQPTIIPCFPKGMNLMKFVSTPPPVHKDSHTGEEKPTRYFCTMIVYEDERGRQTAAEKYGGPFVLYREYLGGLVPLLRGDKISKVRPEFVVYNPQNSTALYDGSNVCMSCHDSNCVFCNSSSNQFSRQKSGVSIVSSPDSKRCASDIFCDHEREGGNDNACIGHGGVGPSVSGAASGNEREGVDRQRYEEDELSPVSGAEADGDESSSSQRRRKKKKKMKGQFRTPVEKISTRYRDLPFPDKLPEREPLIEVLANLWGTKFRLHGIHPNLPTDVGYVSYKTSVLHLQPRQMTIAIPLLDASVKNPKSTSIGTVVFPGNGNTLAKPLGTQLLLNDPSTSNITPRGSSKNCVGEMESKLGMHSTRNYAGDVNERDKTSNISFCSENQKASNSTTIGVFQTKDFDDRCGDANAPLESSPNNEKVNLHALRRHFLAHQQERQNNSISNDGNKPILKYPPNAVSTNQRELASDEDMEQRENHNAAKSTSLGVFQPKNSEDRCRETNAPLESSPNNEKVNLHALRCHFLAHQQKLHNNNSNDGNRPILKYPNTVSANREFASDEEMEQRVIQAVTSVKSGKPMEVAAAVASVLTNRSDDPVVSPMQRCPKHPMPRPLTRSLDYPMGSSPAIIPPQSHNYQPNSSDARMFFSRFSTLNVSQGHVNNSFGSHHFPLPMQMPTHFHQKQFKHYPNHHYVSGGCNRSSFCDPNSPFYNYASPILAFMKQEEPSCRQKSAPLCVRPKSFAGGGIHNRSFSSTGVPNTSHNMFLSLPPAQAPPLAQQPGGGGSAVGVNYKSLSVCRSDEDSADSANETVSHTEKPSTSKQHSTLNNDAAIGHNQSSDSFTKTMLSSQQQNEFSGLQHTCNDLILSSDSRSIPQQLHNCCCNENRIFNSLLFNSMLHNNGCESSSRSNIPNKSIPNVKPAQLNLTDKSTKQSNGSAVSSGATAHPSSSIMNVLPCGSYNSTPSSSTQMTCRQEAAAALLRSELGLSSLTPPDWERDLARVTRFFKAPPPPSSSNSTRKSSPSGRNASATGCGSQYNLCNTKSQTTNGEADSSESDYNSDVEGQGSATVIANNPELRRRQMRKFRKLPRKPENLPKRSEKEEFVMLNKSPIWNESTQVYQLDFGGRVTQESAKNFQIEHNKDQVLQFGRIDDNAYTLDFQTPFSALQAFGIALANVTQRLK